MVLKEIVENYLRDKDFDGLLSWGESGECYCSFNEDGIMTCDDFNPTDCEPCYVYDCKKNKCKHWEDCEKWQEPDVDYRCGSIKKIK